MAKLRDCDKRCVTAGHWVAVNLDTGERAHIVRYGTLERRARRDKFVRKHRDLCHKAYMVNHWHKGGTTTKWGIKLVAKARKVLDYSPKSGSGDLFVGLMHSYKRIFKPGPCPGCDCGNCKYNRYSRHNP